MVIVCQYSDLNKSHLRSFCACFYRISINHKSSNNFSLVKGYVVMLELNFDLTLLGNGTVKIKFILILLLPSTKNRMVLLKDTGGNCKISKYPPPSCQVK